MAPTSEGWCEVNIATGLYEVSGMYNGYVPLCERVGASSLKDAKRRFVHRYHKVGCVRARLLKKLREVPE